MRARQVSLLIAAWCAWPHEVAAQGEGAAARLTRFFPRTFPSGSVADAAVAGQVGARVVQTSQEQLALEFETGDVVLAAWGQSLANPVWAPVDTAQAAAAVPPGAYVVWRTVPGERPVLPPSTVGTQVIDEFVALDALQHTPMRLATMLANQWTLVQQGAGVVLVPSPVAFDSNTWLGRANPLPAASETALRVVTDGVRSRSGLADVPEGDLQAARDHLERKQYLEAVERARRAMVSAVLEPEARADATIVAAAADVYVKAQAADRQHRAALLESEPLFGIVLEAQVNRIQSFLPQLTQLDVDASTGSVFLAGVQLRFPFDVRVLSDFFLLVEYGVVQNSFDARGGGVEVLSTKLQQIGFELMYRPRVASRLKPFVRAGVGLFPFTARCDRSSGNAIDEMEVGGLIGGGIDVWRVSSLHMRTSIVGSYRIVHSKFLPEEAPLFDVCRNASQVDLENGYYDFDLDGWQVGLMLTFEP
jgi:hypothetical protein